MAFTAVQLSSSAPRSLATLEREREVVSGDTLMDPGAQFSLFAGWRHPAMGVAGMGMDLTQAAYRYNQNMMEYYTCKSKSF